MRNKIGFFLTRMIVYCVCVTPLSTKFDFDLFDYCLTIILAVFFAMSGYIEKLVKAEDD